MEFETRRTGTGCCTTTEKENPNGGIGSQGLSFPYKLSFTVDAPETV